MADILLQAKTELERGLNAPLPQPDSSGKIELELDDGLKFCFFQRKDSLCLTGEVAVLPDEDSQAESLCEKLLQSCLGIIKNSAVGLALDQKRLLLQRVFTPSPHSQETFSLAAEDFLNNLSWLRSRAEKNRPMNRPTGNIIIRP